MQIEALFCYPIKSCRGIKLQKLQIDADGPQYDRMWAIVKQDGSVVTQRQNSRLAEIETILTARQLVVKLPGQVLQVDLEKTEINPSSLSAQNSFSKVKIFSHELPYVDEGDEAAGALSAFLSEDVRLVRTPKPSQRRVPEKYLTPEFPNSANARFHYSDGMPLLLTNSSSLDSLNAVLSESVPMNRFRPNIVITGAEAFFEQQMKSIKINNVYFQISKRCTRCVIVNTDQETGKRNPEVLMKLTEINKDAQGKPNFGVYLIQQGAGALNVGDQIFSLT